MNSGMLGRTLLDQFRVDSFVAAGGMATVYRVYDLKRNVPLAMKVLQEDLAEDPAILKRFQREAEALTRLAHPHIVTFYGLFQDGALSFLLERFIDGPTLKDILKNRPGQALALPEVAIWMKAVCSALGYAHANGLVHCDIKPGNVMVDHGGIVYLADFGIARYADTSTTTIASAGTPAYMAPEQIQGMAVSPATDIYALGVVLFELLTGRRPFTGSESGLDSTGGTTGERIRYAHLHLQPPDPRSINPALPLALSQVILQAMAKDPAQRFASTQALFNALCAAGEIRAEEVPDRLDLRWLAPVAAQEGETKPVTQEASGLPSPPTWQEAVEAKSTRKRPAAWLWGIGAGCVLAAAALIIVGGLALAGVIKLLPVQPTAVSAGEKSLQAPQSTLTTTAPPASRPLPRWKFAPRPRPPWWFLRRPIRRRLHPPAPIPARAPNHSG